MSLQTKPHYATVQSGEWFDTETWLNGEIPLYPNRNIWIQHDVFNPPPLDPWTPGTIISDFDSDAHILRLPENSEYIVGEARFREKHDLSYYTDKRSGRLIKDNV